MPLLLREKTHPLKGVVMAISGYMGKERSFLEIMAKMLGAQ